MGLDQEAEVANAPTRHERRDCQERLQIPEVDSRLLLDALLSHTTDCETRENWVFWIHKARPCVTTEEPTEVSSTSTVKQRPRFVSETDMIAFLSKEGTKEKILEISNLYSSCKRAAKFALELVEKNIDNPEKTKISFFREGVVPCCLDPKNNGAGKFTLTLPSKNKCINAFLLLMVKILTGGLLPFKYLHGLKVSLGPNKNTVQLWMSRGACVSRSLSAESDPGTEIQETILGKEKAARLLGKLFTPEPTFTRHNDREHCKVMEGQTLPWAGVDCDDSDYESDSGEDDFVEAEVSVPEPEPVRETPPPQRSQQTSQYSSARAQPSRQHHSERGQHPRTGNNYNRNDQRNAHNNNNARSSNHGSSRSTSTEGFNNNNWRDANRSGARSQARGGARGRGQARRGRI